MDGIQRNLARTWRARDFSQIIGQDLAVKVLRNSLFRGHYFPVYLFWGQRGTGKTSMARIFAAALNCEHLASFQQDPKGSSLPCTTCTSCVAITQGNHPDYIEIDAASHTGVDNVRGIIDAAALLPLMGRKKIFLIDEAHMLSKAAFNALLKVLEEPPASALFILATTDPQKIIDTVRSRCFQVWFRKVDERIITEHLRYLCHEESINADIDALACIARETDGSVRDAINMVERVRFAQGRITRDAVLQLLGHPDDESLANLVTHSIMGDQDKLLALLKDMNCASFDVDYVWRRLLQLLRAALFLRHNIPKESLKDISQEFYSAAQTYPFERIMRLLEIIYQYEPLFNKTVNKALLLETMLIQAATQRYSHNTERLAMSQPVSEQPLTKKREPALLLAQKQEPIRAQNSSTVTEKVTESTQQPSPTPAAEQPIPDKCEPWDIFMRDINTIQDPLMLSIFANASFQSFDQQTRYLVLAFSQQFVFFQDWLVENTGAWKPLLDKAFGCSVIIKPVFTDTIAPVLPTLKAEEKKTTVIKPKQIEQSQEPQKKTFQIVKPYYNHTQKIAKKPIVDVSDSLTWPQATLLKKYFAGVIREL